MNVNMIHGKQDFDKDPVAHQASIEDQVPIIDIAELLVDSNSSAARESVDKIASACSSWGFFQVINHGIAAALVEDVWRQTRAFFAQPGEIKMSVLRSRENPWG
ncbi:MAG: 2-oxoglutarate and iron-dependent oxygenase domain-containing protein, partial [Gammaproteobacteria bacterium]|nr:2-oxoglutarate and iron-dependent oxygenase domain-containing protein [Gammaproteobacteria bacterium]